MMIVKFRRLNKKEEVGRVFYLNRSLMYITTIGCEKVNSKNEKRMEKRRIVYG
jgi:hypothetical protein